MDKILKILNKSMGIYNVGGIDLELTLWMILVLALLAFMLLFTIARVRYLYVHWNLSKTSLSFLFYGFLFALILEGVFIISGRTMFTQILGWENAPKPISTLLDTSRNKLVDVLGITEEISASYASEPPTYKSVVGDYENLDVEDKETVRGFICE
ncbi:hypothetical protein ACFL25_01360 [Patescibacteria group bacterium]